MRSSRLILALCFILGFPVLSHAAAADEYYKAGLSFYQQGRYEPALKQFENAIRANPGHWQSYQAKGYCHYKMGQTQEALASCEKSLKVNPDNPSLQKFVDSMKSEGLDVPAPPTRKSSSLKWKEYGIRAGGVLSTVSGGVGVKMKIGAAVGGYYTMGLGPQMAIEPGLYFVMKGAKIDYSTQIGFSADFYERVETKGSYTLDYLEIPALFKYYFSPERKFHVFGGLGLGFCIIKSLKQTITTTMKFPGEDPVVIPMDVPDGSSALSTTDFIFIIGSGTNLGKMSLDIRYDMSLSSIGGEAKNGALIVTLGFPI